MRFKRALRINNPAIVTLSDCILAYQMGYRAAFHDGRLVRFEREVR